MKVGNPIAITYTATREGYASCEMVVAKQTAKGLAYAEGNRRVCAAFQIRLTKHAFSEIQCCRVRVTAKPGVEKIIRT